jgi:hypothetical protein
MAQTGERGVVFVEQEFLTAQPQATEQVTRNRFQAHFSVHPVFSSPFIFLPYFLRMTMGSFDAASLVTESLTYGTGTAITPCVAHSTTLDIPHNNLRSLTSDTSTSSSAACVVQISQRGSPSARDLTAHHSRFGIVSRARPFHQCDEFVEEAMTLDLTQRAGSLLSVTFGPFSCAGSFRLVSDYELDCVRPLTRPPCVRFKRAKRNLLTVDGCDAQNPVSYNCYELRTSLFPTLFLALYMRYKHRQHRQHRHTKSVISNLR